jgi:hypothetical protein
MRLQELPLVALQPQEPLVFGTPGFPLRSGLKKNSRDRSRPVSTIFLNIHSDRSRPVPIDYTIFSNLHSDRSRPVPTDYIRNVSTYWHYFSNFCSLSHTIQYEFVCQRIFPNQHGHPFLLFSKQHPCGQ